MWWTIFVLDVNDVTLEHRVQYDPRDRQFYGAENLYRLFSSSKDWTTFLHRLFMEQSGTVDCISKEGENSRITWQVDTSNMPC